MNKIGFGQHFSFLRLMALSSVTDDKIFNRYGECGLDGPEDRSRRPYRQATELPFQIEHCILGLKRELSSWRAPKIRDKLIRECPMLKYEP